MRVHSENREYECPVCGKCFKQSSQLRNHRVMHLNRKSNEVPRWYTSKTCELCGKTYADSKCLKNHMQAVHSKLRPYVCNVCGHSSARKAMLQMHLRQHTGDKPYSCELCEYKTGDHNSLRRHIMRHTGRKFFSFLFAGCSVRIIGKLISIFFFLFLLQVLDPTNVRIVRTPQFRVIVTKIISDLSIPY